MTFENIVRRINLFIAEAHKILSVHEAAPSRTVLLDETYKELKELSLEQDELLRQALRCVESKLYRAAHILAWTALIDLIENILALDNFSQLKAVRPKWNISSLDELREEVSEYQIIEACKDLKLISKSEMRVLQGFLGKRNLCAHPSGFFPDYNQTLGYVADILDMIKKIQQKTRCCIESKKI
jgi:hypothetical protein